MTMTTSFGFDIKVVGKAENNRAIMGDIVAVRLHDECRWLSNKHVNLQEDDVDLAVRIGDLPDSSLVATRVGSIRRARRHYHSRPALCAATLVRTTRLAEFQKGT